MTNNFKIKLSNSVTFHFQYTDFTEESVVLKEVTMLRGIELLSSLQNITKPFYLNNLTREQSEDLGRAGEFYITFDFFLFLTFLLCSFLVCTKNRQISKSRSQRMDSI